MSWLHIHGNVHGLIGRATTHDPVGELGVGHQLVRWVCGDGALTLTENVSLLQPTGQIEVERQELEAVERVAQHTTP